MICLILLVLISGNLVTGEEQIEWPTDCDDDLRCIFELDNSTDAPLLANVSLKTFMDSLDLCVKQVSCSSTLNLQLPAHPRSGFRLAADAEPIRDSNTYILLLLASQCALTFVQTRVPKHAWT